MTPEEEQIKKTARLIKSIDEMTDPLWIRDELLPQLSLKAVLENIPVTFRYKSAPLVEVMQKLLASYQPQAMTLQLSEPQKIALKAEQNKEKAIITTAIAHIKKLLSEDKISSERALINSLEPYRKILFSPVSDQQGDTLLGVAQQAYKKLSLSPNKAETASASAPTAAASSSSEKYSWKESQSKEKLPFRTGPLTTNKPTTKSAPVPETPKS